MRKSTSISFVGEGLPAGLDVGSLGLDELKANARVRHGLTPQVLRHNPFTGTFTGTKILTIPRSAKAPRGVSKVLWWAKYSTEAGLDIEDRNPNNYQRGPGR